MAEQTPIEWLEQEMEKKYYADGALYLIDAKAIIQKAKEMQEEASYKEYMSGYQHGWRECDEQIKNDIKILNNKYNVATEEGKEDKTFKRKTKWTKVDKKPEGKFDPNYMHEWIRNNGLRPTQENE